MEVKGLTYVELNMPLTGEIKILSPKNDMPVSFINKFIIKKAIATSSGGGFIIENENLKLQISVDAIYAFHQVDVNYSFKNIWNKIF